MGSDDRAGDWRDKAAYQPLVGADRAIFAWEWLRRDPDYRRAACQALDLPDSPARCVCQPDPEAWGLHRFEHPCRGAPVARPLWRADVHPLVLSAWPEASAASADGFVLEELGADLVAIGAGSGCRHLLFSDGLRSLRLDLLGKPPDGGCVRLRYRLEGFASAEKPLLTLRRLLALHRTGRFSKQLHPPEARAPRWILQLRAFDALTSGAGQREIAALLLGAAASEARWRSRQPSLRSQTQRLVRDARAMARGGYLALLR